MHVTVNGVRLFFDVESASLVPDGPAMREKPTLLLLHGGPGLDHSYFRPAFSQPAELAQVVYLDHRGQGRSERSTPDRWTLAQWADDVRDFCDTLGIEHPIIFGHSFGGMVAMAYAVRHPEHPRKLIFSSTSARQNLPRMLARFEQVGGQEAREAASKFWTQPSPETLPDYVQTAWPVYNRLPHDPDVIQRSVLSLEVLFHFCGGEQRTYNLLPELARVRCPTLVLGGTRDPVCPIEDQEKIVAALPPDVVQFERFEDCGHEVWVDDPQRAFTVIREFLLA